MKRWCEHDPWDADKNQELLRLRPVAGSELGKHVPLLLDLCVAPGWQADRSDAAFALRRVDGASVDRHASAILALAASTAGDVADELAKVIFVKLSQEAVSSNLDAIVDMVTDDAVDPLVRQACTRALCRAPKETLQPHSDRLRKLCVPPELWDTEAMKAVKTWLLWHLAT